MMVVYEQHYSHCTNRNAFLIAILRVVHAGRLLYWHLGSRHNTYPQKEVHAEGTLLVFLEEHTERL